MTKRRDEAAPESGATKQRQKAAQRSWATTLPDKTVQRSCATKRREPAATLPRRVKSHGFLNNRSTIRMLRAASWRRRREP